MDEGGQPKESLWSRVVPRGSHLLAFGVLIASLLLVAWAWTNTRTREMRAARAQFEADSDEVAGIVQARLAQYELITRGGVSLFASVARPTPRQWQSYVEGMGIADRYPAILGLGFAGFVPNSRLPDLQLEWRESGYGLLNVRPRGIRAYYGPVLYLEPRRPENVAAIGYDMYSEPIRHEAMEAALETGRPRLSGAVQLIQDAPTPRSSVQIYLPIYRAGDQPATVSARREAMQGWIYVPFHVREMVETALGSHLDDMHVRIVDVSDPVARSLYDGGRRVVDPAFRRSTTVNLYGRRWRFDFASQPVNDAVPGLRTLQGSLALGLIAALLLYGVAFTLARTGTRAREIAGRLTEEFRRSEVRFRAAMQYSAIGKALVDSRGCIVDINPAFAAMFGRRPDVIVGLPFESLFELREGESLARNDGDGVWRAMRRFHRPDGTTRHVHLTYSPIPGNIGQDVSGLLQMEDVTERLLAEARVHALNRTLEARVALRTRELMRANQELESFAYSVSHDLRAPLRAIDGFSRILAERYADRLDDPGRDYLSRVRRAATRMGELIDSMLQLSRLSRSALKIEAVDLSRMATEVIEELHVADSTRRVEAIVQPGLELDGDATLLRNLLHNLIGNAWKFTRDRDPAVIAFGMTALGEYFVRDNGAGFSQDYVDKLFRPFQRLHTEEHFAGHGIGLATVRRIVERHGGTIRAEGAVGEGATFYFTLPGAVDV
ncbi:PAS domain S-box protein [Lysobacter sp. TY2-98]|uniref:CHASE domain-containing protein n=1 Tax=Lysobacter sp. TY2-98 TaxID=2290922 RepID=UPI000E20BA59|nr:CHASE domain-containing protein [Lysobacter sp. TY2-98]AXK71832.1 PAS domain S-box protein [Lysobacter sp. TY2-98]